VERRDEERVWETESLRREHPFVVNGKDGSEDEPERLKLLVFRAVWRGHTVGLTMS
jgi:hypothetical protein